MRSLTIKRVVPTLLVLAALLGLPFLRTAAQDLTPSTEAESGLDPAEVAQTIRRVADWQLEHPYDYPPSYWTMAPPTTA